MLSGDVLRELNMTSDLLCKLHRAVYVSRRVLCTHLILTIFRAGFFDFALCFCLRFGCRTVRGIRSPQLRHILRVSRSLRG